MPHTANRRGPRKPRLNFHAVSLTVPHPAKEYKNGEDASFISPTALGVYDGVGGWSEVGIDSGQYSKHLASLTKTALQPTAKPVSTRDALAYALRNATEKGTSTMCAARLDADDCLQVCNVGDCGLVVMRNADFHFSTRPQHHMFNQPYQVGFDDRLDFDFADEESVDVAPGDLVILASDGVWDNLRASEVVRIAADGLQKPVVRSKPLRGHCPVKIDVPPRRPRKERPADSSLSVSSSSGSEADSSRARLMDAGGQIDVNTFATRVRKRLLDGVQSEQSAESLQLLKPIAKEIVRRCCGVAYDPSANSPFARKARLEGLEMSGGKLDDITIVVALVVRSDNVYLAEYNGQATFN